MCKRGAATIIELLIVIVISAFSIGLLFPAILKMSEAAARIKSKNNLREIIMSVHNFSATNDGALPSINGANGFPPKSLFVSLLPYIDEDSMYKHQVNPAEGDESNEGVRLYISPADPSINSSDYRYGLCSYPANAQVFYGRHSFMNFIKDGTSNTIGFAEHYASNCDGDHFQYSTAFFFRRRATFADGNLPISTYDDVYPVTFGYPPTSIGSDPNKTFQIAPKREECDPSIAQTLHPSGMQVALMDGSVKALAPFMSKIIYWGTVTPDANEVLGSDW